MGSAATVYALVALTVAGYLALRAFGDRLRAAAAGASPRTWGIVVAAVAAGALLFPRAPALAVAWAGALACLPRALTRVAVARRERRVREDLPFVLDLLALAVRSGMDLGAAWGQASAAAPAGPVREATGAVLRGMRIGRPMPEALVEWGEALGLPAARRLSSSLAQALEAGAPVAPVLSLGGRELREETVLAAEARAQRAPVTMLFPLVLCVMPAVFVVLLGPSLLRVIG